MTPKAVAARGVDPFNEEQLDEGLERNVKGQADTHGGLAVGERAHGESREGGGGTEVEANAREVE